MHSKSALPDLMRYELVNCTSSRFKVEIKVGAMVHGPRQPVASWSTWSPIHWRLPFGPLRGSGSDREGHVLQLEVEHFLSWLLFQSFVTKAQFVYATVTW